MFETLFVTYKEYPRYIPTAIILSCSTVGGNGELNVFLTSDPFHARM